MNPFNITAPIDKTWSLFLDRDGVVNVEVPGTYITDWTEFRFCAGALDALKTLNELFGHIVVVTNQRGVGRGIMSLEQLREINVNMTREVSGSGGRIDRIYACTAVSDQDHNRKPNTGMAMQAREDFPAIDFRRSVIVGNSISDMEFGKRLAMHTVFLTTKHPPFELPHPLIDEQHESLNAWVMSLTASAVVG